MIGFFARQLVLLQIQNSSVQNDGFHSEYSKLNRFLSVINLNKKSIEVYQFFSIYILNNDRYIYFFYLFKYIVQRMTFDDLLNGKATAREKLLYDAETTETERKDFRNALNALKDCIGIYFFE